jgi:hypothetical protein
MGANAQTSVPLFTAGDVLTAANQNISAGTGVPVFATTTTRDAAFGGTGEKTLAEGQTCYLESTKAIQVYNGTTWLNIDTTWIAYTPTWTNVTVGNATQNFRYMQQGKLVFVIGSLVWGSTTSATATGFIFSLPITSATGANSQYWGTVSYLDSGTEEYVGGMRMASTSTMALRAPYVNGTYITSGDAVKNTVPFTWTTNDSVLVSFFYEAA